MRAHKHRTKGRGLRRERVSRLPAFGLAFVALLPIAALGVLALQGDTRSLAHLASTVLPGYVGVSLALLLGVAALTSLMGVASAWVIARYEFPLRRMFSIGLTLPLAMPAYVSAYALSDWLQFAGPVQSWMRASFGWQRGDYWFPEMRSLFGAILVLSLALYPYVYLIVRDAFAARAATLIDAARTLGCPPHVAFWRVVLPMARPAWVAGLALVLMETLADFGAVSYLGVDTLSVGIFRSWFGLGDRAAAAQLALGLLAFVGLMLALQSRVKSPAQKSSVNGDREVVRGVRALFCQAVVALPCLLGFALPAVLLLRLWLQDADVSLVALPRWIAGSALFASLAAVFTVALAGIVTFQLRSSKSGAWQLARAVWGWGYALPGAVLAVGLLWVFGVIDDGLTRLTGIALFSGTFAALLFAMMLRFFNVSVQSLEIGAARLPRSLDLAAQSLGIKGLALWRRLYVPLLWPSVLTAFLVAFIDAAKELPATLMLRPFNFDTLATATYTLAKDERLGEAALPSLCLVLLGLVPVWWVNRKA